jgi:predicted permease
MEAFLKDLKHSVRMFLQAPGFIIAAIAALALGIGANTAIFSVVNTVILKPLSYPDPSRIVRLLVKFPQGSGPSLSVPEFMIMRQARTLQDVSAYDSGGPGVNLTGGESPEQLHGIHVSQDYFRLFGAPLLQGRTFSAEEDAPKGPHVTVLSEGLWRRRFGADPNIIGKTIPLGGEPHVVIGIVSSSFNTDTPVDIWLPLQADPNSTNTAHYFNGAARLRPGVTLKTAQAELGALTKQLVAKFPLALGPQGSLSADKLQDAVVSQVRSQLFVLTAAVSFVLLIACANVANLLLVRASGRRREIAIRAAVGAGRGRIIRQLLTESVLLSLVGGALGLILGLIGLRALLAINPGNIPRIGEHGSAVTLDWRVLLFTAAVALVTGVLFGLIPALDASHADLTATLKESSGRSGTGFRQNKARSILVVTETALAIVLLIGAGLLIRTFIALRDVNPGFNSHHVLVMDMSLTGPRFQKTAGVADMVRDAVQRVEALPGVVAAATASTLPLEGGLGLPFTIVGRPLQQAPFHGGAAWMNISPDYFAVFRIPLLRGRFFTERDDGAAPGVVIINEAMARQFWPKGKGDPLSDRIFIAKGLHPFDEPARQIVGIVADTRDGGLNQDPSPTMYVPVSQVRDGVTALNVGFLPIEWVIRTHGDPHLLSAPIQRELRQGSGGLPVAHIRSMDEVVVNSTARDDFNMSLLTIFAGSALLLAAIGIYGLMSYSVQQRTQEIGIRMALGAESRDVRRMVLIQGMRLVIAGVVLGVAGACGLTRLLSSFLFGVKPLDPTVFVAVPILLSVIALFAIGLPATRATAVDPLNALRYE